MNLVTGYRGYKHVKSEDVAAFNRAFFGASAYVLKHGRELAAELVDTNLLRIYDGELLICGYHARIEPGSYEDVTLTPGTAGTYRRDYIVAQYERESSGIETVKLVHLTGASASTESGAALPSLTQNDLSNYGTVYQMPLYTILFSGLSAGDPVSAFGVTISLLTYISNLTTKIDSVNKSLTSKIDSVNTSLTNKINSVKTELETKITNATNTLNSTINSVKSNLQNQINGKQASITGGATTITSSNLTGNRALISNSSGKVAVSSTTATELSYLSKLSGNVQSQINTLSNNKKGISFYYGTAASTNISSKWTYNLLKFTSITKSSGSTSASLSGGQWVAPAAGTIIVAATASFAANSSGARAICIRRIMNGSTSSQVAKHVGAIGHGITLSTTGPIRVGKGATIGLYVGQDSGKTLAVSGSYNILFIPDL